MLAAKARGRSKKRVEPAAEGPADTAPAPETLVSGEPID